MSLDLSYLPTVNACLNALSAFFLSAGLFFIKQKKVETHKKCMLLACITSVLFLVSYLFYHYHHGATRYQGQGILRPLYFSILISHTLLAVIIVPLVLMTLTRAFRSQFERHRKIARITLPIWLYISITGVVIYWMLYHA